MWKKLADYFDPTLSDSDLRYMKANLAGISRIRTMIKLSYRKIW